MGNNKAVTHSEAAQTDFGEFSTDYQFWIEHQATDQLVQSIRRLMPEGGVVLDAGCGDGSLSVALAPYVDRVVGVDLEPEMIALARRKADGESAQNVSFMIGDLGMLGIADDAFDIVVSSFALHHTPVETTLPSLARTIKPGGWFFLQEPSCPVSGALRQIWYRWLALRIAARAVGPHGLDTALKLGRFHLGKKWISHQIEDEHWDAGRWRTVVTRLLPGAAFQHAADKSAVTILWQRKVDGRGFSSTSSQRMAPEADVDLQAPIEVGRRYPQPPPPDYVEFPRSEIESSVVARFETQVGRHEARIAYRTTELELTYGQMNAAANRVARSLLAVDAAGDTPVAILMDQDDPVIPVIFGILKAGRAYVVLDPADTPDRQAQVLALAGAETVVTTAARSEGGKVFGDELRRRLVWEELDAVCDDNPGLSIEASRLAAIFFTSGSTGEPKGVARDHRQFLHSTWLNTNTYYVAPSDRQSLLYFPGFTASVPNIYDTLLNGATLCSINPRRVSPAALIAWLGEERITHFNPPVGLWRELIHAMPPGSSWPHLRLITLAGQPIYGKDVRDFQSTFGPLTTLLYPLAMTEAGAVTQGYIDKSTPAGDGPVPAGYALADKEISILDENGSPVEAGESGRVAITSAYLSIGYWRDDERTDSTFRPAADGSNRRTFITSDRGSVRADGCLQFFGRADSIVKVRGYRVDTAAVEAALNGHPRVTHAAVVTRERKNAETSLAAFLASSDDERPTTQELRTHVGKILPHYMVPERFFWLDTMPLTASGKIDRRTLSRFEADRAEPDRQYTAPRTDLEEIIAEIWETLLEVDAVGVDESFFELGGDSLLAMRMLQNIEEQLGIESSPQYLRASTVAELARLISNTSNKVRVEAHAISDTESGSGRPRRKLTSAKRVLRHVMKIGPITRGRPLPYAVGVRAHRVLAGRRRFFDKVYAKELSALHKWQSELGTPELEQALSLSIFANTWKFWRDEALLAPGVIGRWVHISGAGSHLLQTRDVSEGTVFCVPHAGRIMYLLRRIVEENGREAMLLTNDRRFRHIEERDIRSSKKAQSLSIQLWKAQQVLKRNGVVFIAGDGPQGSQSVDVPFWGRRRPFQTGVAWLAATTGARFVPVFAAFDLKGQLNIEVTDPLATESESEEGRVVEMTESFGALYAERWPEIYTSMLWAHLERSYDYPKM